MGRIPTDMAVFIVLLAFQGEATAQVLAPPQVSTMLVGRSGGPSAVTRLPHTFTSANKRFQVALEPDPLDATVVRASMSKIAGESQVQLWTTTVSMRAGPVPWAEVLVSDAGDCFVYSLGMHGDIRMRGKEIHTTLQVREPMSDPFRLTPSLSEQLPVFDVAGGENVFRLWNRFDRAWAVFRTTDGKELPLLKINPLDIERWNKTAREAALAKLYGAQRSALQQKAKQINAPVAKLASLALTNTAGWPSETDYEFLTTLKNPEDRKWIEDLVLNGEASRRGYFSWVVFRGDPYFFEETDHVRSRGDRLLALWDGKAKYDSRASSGDEANAPRYYLGRVTGAVRLPLPMPIYQNATQATLLHLRLTRADDVKKKSGSIREQRLACSIGFERARNRKVVYDATFAFTTVLPGTYRLKAIWDKRAPLTNTNSPGPGDYESAWSAPFTIAAGQTGSNFVLFCTNQIAGGESYYAADRLLEKEWIANDPPAPSNGSTKFVAPQEARRQP